ncbi:MAG: DUF1460 domain-containing protein [Bacteroidaceae bacterium]|nr:DUF1460 domain-containing protein [Bacteroidaceae bacterium]
MRHRLHLFLLLLAVLWAATEDIFALTYQPADSTTVVNLLKKGVRQPKGENLMLYFANQLLDRPYVGKTLEVNPKEELAVNLRELDCTTLVENVVALVLTTQQQSTRFADFCRNLERIRYRDGRLNGYASRNHYFSEWILSNERQGLVTEVTGHEKDSRGAFYPFVEPQTLQCNYMTNHPNQYPMLKGDEEAQKQIQANEKRINGRTIHYIPRRLLSRSRKELGSIQDGDILAIVTKKAGLDVSHLGIAVWGTDGQLHLLNASQIHKRVILEPLTLAEYMKKHPTQLGVRVIRVNN